MPRAEKLSNRLDGLLEAIFEAPSDPFSLYWDIAAQLRPDQLAQVQTKIRKTLRQKEEIGAESAVLVACLLHLTGFPEHRLLHFLSLYVPGGIRLALFELAISAIFSGEPPIPAPLLYDITQYTYLEKRLLVRKSMEISETLKGSLSPAVLLHLYLLSLRDDLSNENIQLIALIMKNCFPALEVRTRIGGASLEEYGEIARAWKNAEKRSLDLEISTGSGGGRGGARAFDRDSASYFLDKYFSDEALSEMRAAAALSPSRRVPPRSAARRGAAAGPGAGEETSTLAPSSRAGKTANRKGVAGRAAAQIVGGRRGAARDDTEAAASRGRNAVHPAVEPAAARGRGGIQAATETGANRGRDRVRVAAETPASKGGGRARTAAGGGIFGGVRRRVVWWVPTALAAVLMAALILSMPAGFPSSVAGSATRAPVQEAPAAVSTPAPTVSSLPVPQAAAAPATTTYVVRPGDSLWKIFGSMRAQNPDRRGWVDFLSKARSLNSLGDPDLLRPGKVLTLSLPE